MTQLFSQIDILLSRQERVVLAIDGFCTSGKTTLAEQLRRHYGCCVIHMDDFFLRPEQRNADRLSQPGGNIDYERFQEEVLLPLQEGIPFSYRPYDCSTGTLADPIQVTPGKLTVIEGSYSHHPYFGPAYDMRLFLTVTADQQRSRILERPQFLQQRFFDEWIPMELAYFSAFSIPEKADMVINPTLLP